ncbi:putative ribonuclease H-like domain-containing protein [Tanacetum coccineum]
MTHPSPKRNMVSKAVLMRSGLVSLNTAKPVNTAQPRITVNIARPMTNVFNKTYSTVRRTINNKTTTKNSIQKVNTVRGNNVNTARPKAVVNAVKGNHVNDVKASACWVWKPKTKGNPQQDLQEKGVIDSGCSRHMTWNMSHLTDFEEIDGGYVAFGGNPKGGKITATKDETSGILKSFITGVENLIDQKVKAKAVNIACYVQNRVLVTKPHNKTPYELFLGRKPALGFMKPFGCPVRILNTIDHLGKFDGKADEGFFVSENTPNIVGSGPNWLFDIDALTKSMNYKPVFAGNQSNGNSGTKACDDAGKVRMETSSQDDGSKPSSDDEKKVDEDPRKDSESIDQEKDDNVNSTNNVNAASINEVNAVGGKTSIELPDDLNMPTLKDYSIFDLSSDDQDNGVEVDMNNLDTTIQFSKEQTIKTFKIACLLAFYHKKNPKRNKKDERGIVIKNKARLVAQGYTQEERIDYDEVFAPVAKIKVIRLFLAYASFKDFVVYQMDVKNAFLYGKIEEEVYVCQPPGFEDPYFPNRVYKVEKALYRLHQVPRAWYETLSTYLLDNGFLRGKIDKTLFIKRDNGDILLVQVYVDDIIFGSTKKELCNAFEKLMHEKFQMSSMGELTFFLGLQVKQKKDGIFISQDKHVAEILKKFGFAEVKTASTPMETQKHLLKDEDGEEVDVHMYRSIIGSLMYLTSSRPDIMFAVCACARYQVNPKVSHLHAVNRIFRYLKDQPKLGLWYPKDSPFNLVAYTDSDYAGASLYRKSTTGDLLTKAFDATVKAKTVNGEVLLQALVDGKKIIIIELIVRRDLQLEYVDGVDCLPNATIFEQLTMMGYEKLSQKLTFYKAFFSQQWKFLIHMILQCLSAKTTAWNEFSSTMASAIICLATNQKFNFSKYIFERMSTHKRIYIAPSHTKKIFRNMRRVGKGFSRRDMPLFQTMVVQAQAEIGEGLKNSTDPHHTPTIIQPSTSQPQMKQRLRRPKRKYTRVPLSSVPSDNVADEAVNEEMDDSLVRSATTASSLEAEQDSGNIIKTRSKAEPNEAGSQETTSGGGPRRHDTMGDTIAQTRFENVSKTSNDSLLAGVKTP